MLSSESVTKTVAPNCAARSAMESSVAFVPCIIQDPGIKSTTSYKGAIAEPGSKALARSALDPA